MRMKDAFIVGAGVGFVVGTYLVKHCPVVAQAYDNAETNIKNKVEECKESVKRKKQSGSMAGKMEMSDKMQMPEQGF